MDWIGQYHPQIIHTPIALLVFSALFAIVGRLFDRDWVRKASVLLLVFGLAGAQLAVFSGRITEEIPEKKQGVPEKAIDEHGNGGQYTVWLAGGALLAIALASRFRGGPATALATFGLLLQIAAAVMVGITGYRGGRLVFEHGAGVRIAGELVKNPGATSDSTQPPGR